MEIIKENPNVLAWIGDAVFTLEVRKHLVQKDLQRLKSLQLLQNRFNSAKAQASVLERLKEKDYFTSQELEILRRGRNASVHSKAKNADLMTYKLATSLEALIGYLYLYNHHERLMDLMNEIFKLGEQS